MGAGVTGHAALLMAGSGTSRPAAILLGGTGDLLHGDGVDRDSLGERDTHVEGSGTSLMKRTCGGYRDLGISVQKRVRGTPIWTWQ